MRPTSTLPGTPQGRGLRQLQHLHQHLPMLALLMLVLVLAAVPLLGGLWHALQAGLDSAGWTALWQEPQTLAAAAMSLWTGLASTALACAAAAWLLSRGASAAGQAHCLNRQAAPAWLPWLLAVPHAAFAMGLVLWIAPAGWLLRLLSPWATGWSAPPPWPTTQDPWGLGLVAVLAAKEIPFLLWTAGAYLLQPDVAQRLRRELQIAATLGYAPHTAWWRIVWPQLLARLKAPLLAVLAYSLTVVDVALVIGPGSPPTLAVLAWQWLQDASAAENAKGAAAAWALAGLVLLTALVAWTLFKAPGWRRWRVRGAPAAHRLGAGARPVQGAARVWRPDTLLPALYCAVLLALLLGSCMGSWPFPQLLPSHWSSAAWRTVWESRASVWTTLWLAAASAACALAWVLAWLEVAGPRWQARMQTLAYAPLLLPGLLWVLGLHRLALAWDLDATATGLWLAHTLACLPYVLLSVVGAYRGYDARYAQLAATLGQGRWRFLLRVKWPMLRAALASGFAVGFAVSVAQYLPTLYLGAGRFSTVTTEAVALAAGGQRALMAAFAWLQWLLPALVFLAAARLGQPRRFRRTVPPKPGGMGTMPA